DWLRKWESLHPTDPAPVARLALIEHSQGRTDIARMAMERALKLAGGPARAPLALAAARIALGAGQRDDALRLIEECLKFESSNSVALSALAALLCTVGTPANLATIAEPLATVGAGDPWFHYLVAVSAFLGGQDAL